MIRLVALGGTGDVYLICALMRAFKQHHGREDVEVIIRAKYSAIADMFPDVRYIIDDETISRAEADQHLQRTYDNAPLSDATPFFAHPCFLKSPTRVDFMTTKTDASQADMYRMILGVPPMAPLTRPRVPEGAIEPDTVLLIPDAVSWPNTQTYFWGLLADALAAIGRKVQLNDPAWPLAELLRRCATTEWVIGPQCGVMSILCTGGFPCRKTVATPSIDDARDYHHFLARETYPYAYVTKFANDDYDVEEFKVTFENRSDIVQSIAQGSNALRLWSHNPGPVLTLQAPMTPGDALDRLAVLTVKRARFDARRRAAIDREYQRFLEITRAVRLVPEVAGYFARLVTHHEHTFMLLERMVPAALGASDAEICPEDHVAAVRANRERIDLKRAIDRACKAPYTEEKSYYDAAP